MKFMDIRSSKKAFFIIDNFVGLYKNQYKTKKDVFNYIILFHMKGADKDNINKLIITIVFPKQIDTRFL